MRHFQHSPERQIKFRKVAYVNGRISEMIRQGSKITPFDIARIEIEGKKLILPKEEFFSMINNLVKRFENDNKMSRYLSELQSNENIMTPN